MRSKSLNRYSFTLKPRSPFQFTPHIERFTLEGRPTPFLWFGDERILRLAVRVDERLVGVEACFRGEPWEPVVELSVYAESFEAAENASRVFGEMIRAELDYREFMYMVKSIDQRLYELTLRHPGLRPGRCTSLYAALIDSVVKQRISLPIALRIYSSLVERYGVRIDIGEHTYYWHPAPERLVESSVDELRELGLTRVKARAIREIALAELEERLPSIDEAAQNPDQVVDELMKLYGVGRWTAQLTVAMVSPKFPLGPVDDLAVVRGLSNILGYSRAEDIAKHVLKLLPDYGGLILYLAAYEYEEVKRKRIRQDFE